MIWMLHREFLLSRRRNLFCTVIASTIKTVVLMDLASSLSMATPIANVDQGFEEMVSSVGRLWITYHRQNSSLQKMKRSWQILLVWMLIVYRQENLRLMNRNTSSACEIYNGAIFRFVSRLFVLLNQAINWNFTVVSYFLVIFLSICRRKYVSIQTWFGIRDINIFPDMKVYRVFFPLDMLYWSISYNWISFGEIGLT